MEKLIRRGGLLFAILLTLLLAAGAAGADMSLDQPVSMAIDCAMLALQAVVCIGAWLVAFGRRAGAAMVKCVLTIYRVALFAAALLAALLTAYLFYVLVRFGIMEETIDESLAGVYLILALGLAATLFLASAFFKHAKMYAAEIHIRLTRERAYQDRRVLGSWMPAGLLLLGIVLSSGMVLDALAARAVISYSRVYGELNELISGILGIISDIYPLGDFRIALVWSSVAASGIDKYLGYAESALRILVCFCGFFYGIRFKKLIRG